MGLRRHRQGRARSSAWPWGEGWGTDSRTDSREHRGDAGHVLGLGLSLWVRGQHEKALLGVCRSCPHQIPPQFSSVTPWPCSPAPGRPWDPSTSRRIPSWGIRGKGGIVKQARPRAAKQRQRQRAEQSRLGAGVTARRSWSRGSKLVPAGPSCSECLRASPARPRCPGKLSSLHGLTTFSEDCTAASSKCCSCLARGSLLSTRCEESHPILLPATEQLPTECFQAPDFVSLAVVALLSTSPAHLPSTPQDIWPPPWAAPAEGASFHGAEFLEFPPPPSPISTPSFT